eukprot:TRINITY_DN69252_c0_g1_i1.p1 TRINITY_DN69252_c0_g1~~TRINITY_DN69252_c0_g1_i1.p1  ORF type:complete len:398 (-),score=64.26 TRINITY_DN69252_c0_g1_i1:36-1229(-)
MNALEAARATRMEAQGVGDGCSKVLVGCNAEEDSVDGTRLETRSGGASLGSSRSGSPMYKALLNHESVATPCGRVRCWQERPDELSSLTGRVRIASPADGVLDPSVLGTADARDELRVEMRAAFAPCGAASERICTLRLWVFLAHLVLPADLLPADSDDEHVPSAASAIGDRTDTDSRGRSWTRGTLEGAFDDGNWTGTLLWDAAIHTAAFLLGSADWGVAIAQSRCVLELGAGLGLPALACAAVLGAGRVVATDRAPQVLDLLEENIARSGLADSGVSVESLNWSADAAKELHIRLGVPCIDVVLCCDCIHEELFGATELLAEFLGSLAQVNAGLRVLISTEWRSGCGLQLFLDKIAAAFEIVQIERIAAVQLFELRALPHASSESNRFAQGGAIP